MNLDILCAIGAPPVEILNKAGWDRARQHLGGVDIVVDALLGTGLHKPVSGLFSAVIRSMNDDFPRATIVSIDIPSGLPADGAQPIGPAVRADMTITFTAMKPALVFAPNCQSAGEVVVAAIGNPAPLINKDEHRLNLITASMFRHVLGPRPAVSNKGSYGKALIIAGSRGKSGAASMAGQAALRSGAGLVTVAAPGSALPMVAASMPELMTEPLDESPEGCATPQKIARLIEGKSIMAIGPGLGVSVETRKFVKQLVRESRIPVVLDADGLNAFAGDVQGLRGSTKRPIVITPHPGEMARLIGRDIPFVEDDRMGVAGEFARSHDVYVVLKGFRTVVATPDGPIFINSTGNPGMATGGTGDILTGMITGILGQERPGTFVERLCLAVFMHGLAGDLAAKELGETSMVATDLLRFLPKAWLSLAPLLCVFAFLA